MLQTPCNQPNAESETSGTCPPHLQHVLGGQVLLHGVPQLLHLVCQLSTHSSNVLQLMLRTLRSGRVKRAAVSVGWGGEHRTGEGGNGS